MASRRTEKRKDDLERGVDGSCYVEQRRKHVDGRRSCCLALANCSQDEGVDFQEGRACYRIEPGMVGSCVWSGQNMGHVELLHRHGQVLQGPILLLVLLGTKHWKYRSVSTIAATTCQQDPPLF